jgi:hypothetical protein
VTLAGIGASYLAAGVAIAAIAAIARRLESARDAALIIALWPLWAPLALSRRDEPGALDPRERELLGALARAQSSPLAAALPDAATARRLGERLREAARRLAELDAVLARPGFDPESAERRASELAARDATAAAATARLRARTLIQLRALRAQFRADLDEVQEGIAQLVAQAELVRLHPASAPASGALVRELVAQIEGLEDLFAAHAALAEYPSPPEALPAP